MGYSSPTLPVMMWGSTTLAPGEGDHPVVFVGDSLRLSGFSWGANTQRALEKTVWAAVDQRGSGTVVVFASDLLFRGFWRGPARLLTNAILFGSRR